MIRRLSVKNYRSLVDFTWEPSLETLVLGANGSGKSSAIDALNVIRGFALGWDSLQNLIGPDDVTVWADGGPVAFALELEAGADVYAYDVQFELVGTPRVASVSFEQLALNNHPVFERHHEDLTSHETSLWPGGALRVPKNQSAVVQLLPSAAAEPYHGAIAALTRMVAVRPMPPLMEAEARRATPKAHYQFENFVEWYWALAGNSRIHHPLSEMLREVWPEFDSLVLEPVGRDTMALTVRFGPVNGSKKGTQLEFQQLSDGERMLLALYSLAAYQQITEPTTIIVDEPDNFVSLAELQPWVLKMLDDRPEGGQVILVSHNPEVIATMGESRVSYFDRDDHMSTTRVSRIKPDDTGLSLSERIARGWVGE